MWSANFLSKTVILHLVDMIFNVWEYNLSSRKQLSELSEVEKIGGFVPRKQIVYTI